jgi:hypothetical protein
VTAQTTTFAVQASSLEVSRSDIECALGYSQMPPPEYLPEMIDAALVQAQALLDVHCGCSIIAAPEVEILSSSVRCRSVELATGAIIARRLRHSTSIALFAATIGKGVEMESRRLMDAGDMMSGFIYDTVGSVFAEAAAEFIERTIGASAAGANEQITNRYSPGYCDWDVAGQHALFSLLPARFCGISLTRSALMLPVKSVSGIIGIGASVKREAYQCSICDMEDCIRKKYIGSHTGAQD